MPYIPDKNRRQYLKETLDPINGGELNFILYYLSLKYLDKVGTSYGKCEELIGIFDELILRSAGGTSSFPFKQHSTEEWFQSVKKDPINETELLALFKSILGRYVKNTGKHPLRTLRCCQLEFYRRITTPYEDKKIIENGDVTP